ncbi:MAG: metal-dependent transcriptional regulator [Ruminococcus sp.]|nr:metal-dependent transcriptional regulator [Ruminococcus sp.]
MALMESGEMYLETILVLSQQKSAVRSIDVAEHMSFSKPSVSRAVGLLKDGGYLTVDGLGHLTLTESGRAVAERIYERHRILSEILMRLGVDEKTATDDACKMEHYISDTSFSAIKAHLKAHPMSDAS